MGTIDGHLIALDAKTGEPLWNVDGRRRPEAGYAFTLAPLVVKDKVIVGTGRRRIRHPRLPRRVRREDRQGSLALQHDSRPGRARPRDMGRATPGRRGGASVWVTGSYDPELEPDVLGHRQSRAGLERRQPRPATTSTATSVVALDADTGKLKWHFQFTPHDEFDYDATQVPVLADIQWQGRPRKVMLWANRNGFFYVLDRTNGRVPARASRS